MILTGHSVANRKMKALKGMDRPCLLAYKKHIRQYVLYKFLLDDEGEIATDNINAWAQ